MPIILAYNLHKIACWDLLFEPSLSQWNFHKDDFFPTYKIW